MTPFQIPELDFGRNERSAIGTYHRVMALAIEHLAQEPACTVKDVRLNRESRRTKTVVLVEGEEQGRVLVQDIILKLTGLSHTVRKRIHKTDPEEFPLRVLAPPGRIDGVLHGNLSINPASSVAVVPETCGVLAQRVQTYLDAYRQTYNGEPPQAEELMAGIERLFGLSQEERARLRRCTASGHKYTVYAVCENENRQTAVVQHVNHLLFLVGHTHRPKLFFQRPRQARRRPERDWVLRFDGGEVEGEVWKPGYFYLI